MKPSCGIPGLLLAAALALPAAAQAPASYRYMLMDPAGRAVASEDFRGRFQLVAFGYASCPDVCPTTLLEMKEILQSLGDEARRLQAIFITVDPERDTRQILKEYTAAFHPDILGLTGAPDLVRWAATNFKVRYEKAWAPDTPTSRYTVDHSAGMVLLGQDGGFEKKFPYGMPAAEIVRQIRTLMATSPR